MRKKVLTLVTSGLIFIGVCFSFLPFVKSLSPQNNDANLPFLEVSLDDLEEGVPIFGLLDSLPIIILKPSPEQLKDLSILNPSYKESPAYKSTYGIFVYSALGKKRSYYCEIKHYPKYSKNKHSSPKQKWHGGYISSPCDINYDYSGNAISHYEYSYNGYFGDFPSLEPAYVKEMGDNTIYVYPKKVNKAI